ncbi:Glycosyl phosphatidyl inositol protein transamidase complex subunit [Saitoella coloradoensis]
MGLLRNSALLRDRSDRIKEILFRLLPALRVLCVVAGIFWFLILPLDNLTKNAYISENALLPGQVNTYFGWSEDNVQRAYIHETNAVKDASREVKTAKVEEVFDLIGLNNARQTYRVKMNQTDEEKTNVYGILRAPRGDTTEAIVLGASWKSIQGGDNDHAVALVLGLARYFTTWSLWAKDIIILITEDPLVGPKRFLDAYYGHTSADTTPLPLKSGVIQQAVWIDFAHDEHETDMRGIELLYDGLNGQMPNMDIVNSAYFIANGQMGLRVSIPHSDPTHDTYPNRLRTLLHNIYSQFLGGSTGPHSYFPSYKIDAITIRATATSSVQHAMTLGRTVESLFRTLNNLLEHLHHSTFFYLSVSEKKFSPVGTYLPGAMMLSIACILTGIEGWSKKTKSGGLKVNEMLTAICMLIAVHGVGLGFFALMCNTSSPNVAFHITVAAKVLECSAPLLTPKISFDTKLLKVFSLLMLGMILSAFASLNFALVYIIGALISPLNFVRPISSYSGRIVVSILLQIVNPTTLMLWLAMYPRDADAATLQGVMGTFKEWGTWSPLFCWVLWWPATLVGLLVTNSRESFESVPLVTKGKNDLVVKDKPDGTSEVVKETKE